jgi:hypothetical protein
VRDDFGRAVVITAHPDDVDSIGEPADQGENLPMPFSQPAEIDRVEHISVEDEAAR